MIRIGLEPEEAAGISKSWDIEEWKAVQREINPLAVLAACDKALAQMCKDRNGFALILIDLDDFKQINDRYGHLAGRDNRRPHQRMHSRGCI